MIEDDDTLVGDLSALCHDAMMAPFRWIEANPCGARVLTDIRVRILHVSVLNIFFND